MSRRRDLLLVMVLFGVLAGVTVLTYPLLPREEPQPPFPTTHSAAPEGCLALYLWLADLGYDVRRVEGEFVLPENVDVLFVVGPTWGFERSDARALAVWVDRGHDLVLTPDLFGDEELWNQLYVDRGTRRIEDEEATPVQPVLLDPLVQRVAHGARRGLITRGLDYVPVLGSADEPVMLTFTLGQGRVYVLADEFPFTNAGVDQADNARLVLNLVGAPGRIVAFDEVHHGYQRAQVSLEEGLFTQPWGWAVVYGVVVGVLYLALRGRRLGRPVPLARHQRRTVAEYVSAMAGLFRRAGQRDAVRRHYRREFRRQLAQPYGVDPELDVDEFVQQLSRYRPVAEHQDRLRDLLYRLNRPAGEADLLRMVQEMEEFVKRKA